MFTNGNDWGYNDGTTEPFYDDGSRYYDVDDGTPCFVLQGSGSGNSSGCAVVLECKMVNFDGYECITWEVSSIGTIQLDDEYFR